MSKLISECKNNIISLFGFSFFFITKFSYPNFNMILSLFVKVSILNVLALSLLQAQGVSSLGRVGGGGGVGRGGSTFKKESPFNIIQTNRGDTPQKIFNVARVRGGSKESVKLIKLFTLIKENYDQNYDKSSLPTDLKFTIIQHVRDKELFIAKNGNKNYALKFSKPKDLVDQDSIVISPSQLEGGGHFEYSSISGEDKTLRTGKRTIRLYNILEKSLLLEPEVVVPSEFISESGFTKETFLTSLKSGGIFKTKITDEFSCSECTGGYVVIKTSSLGRDRKKCKHCQGKGKINTTVLFHIVWDVSSAEVEREY